MFNREISEIFRKLRINYSILILYNLNKEILVYLIDF